MQVPSAGHRKKPDPQDRGAGTKERGAYASGHLPPVAAEALGENLCQLLLHTAGWQLVISSMVSEQVIPNNI